MLNPSRVIDNNSAGHPLIAGSGSGVKVYCHRKFLPLYNTLVKVARNGNHHARLAVSGIVGLRSGHLHMDNIYKPGSQALSSTRKEIYMAILPGIRVNYLQQDNGSFIVVRIELDDTYTRQQRETTRPGLWRAKRQQLATKWSADFVENGKLEPGHSDRFVIIADRTTEHPDEVASSTFETLESSRDKTTVRLISKNGFDLHYTPGNKRIGGWKNLKEVLHANTSTTLRESAELLAHTMRHASSISGVVWGSEEGGSGILTRAMQILADQGVKLNNHGIFLNRATTLPSKAVELARKLDINAQDVSKKHTFSLDQLAGQLCFFDSPVSSLARLKNDEEYTVGCLARDAAKGSFDAIGNTHTTLGAAGLFGAAVASSPVVTQVGGILALTSVVIKTLENVAPEASRRPLWPRK